MPLLTVLLALGPAEAATIEVNPDACLAPGIACTITEALSAAVSGDIIRWTPVADGDTRPAIQENVVVDGTRFAALTIESAMGSDSTVWRLAGGVGTQIRVQNGATLTVHGFRFEHDPEEDVGADGCIQADHSTLVVQESDFVLCRRDTVGGAIAANEGGLEISDSYFFENSAGLHGGAIFFGAPDDPASSLLIERTEIEDSYAIDPEGVGGAVAARYIENVTILDSYFRGNQSLARGGALSVEFGDDLVMEGNTFQQNASFYFLASDEFDDSDEGESVGLVFSTGQGGAVFFDGEAADFSQNLFCGNLADDGGGVYTADVMVNEYRNNVFADNWATHYGGGLNVTVNDGDEATEPIIRQNTFVGNSAGLFPDPQVIVVFGAGGAIALDGLQGDIRNNIISDTYFGGGIFGNDGELFVVGDPIDIEYNLLYENCDFINCEESGSRHYTSDLATYAVSVTNVRAHPQLIYYRAETDCYPDAFYPHYNSPARDKGDPELLDITGSQSDIGAFGGESAACPLRDPDPAGRLCVKDEDGDEFENIYDCNDLDDEINPLAADECDQIDNNCDGEIDEDFQTEWFPDNDRDGYGDAEVFVPIFDCANLAPAFVNNNDDCDDADDQVNPGLIESCDDKDNDCDGTIDNPDELVFNEWIPDADGDGFGDATIGGVIDCVSPGVGFVATGGDCDDTNASINPNAAEVCDDGTPVDNDCDGQIDEDPSDPTAVWYLDQDQDGVGAGDPVVQCDAPDDGFTWVNEAEDCDDDDGDSFPAVERVSDGAQIPGGVDVCDGRDNDCNGTVDDDVTQQTAWYLDGDADGIGDNATVLFACDEPGGSYVSKGGDCDDENPDVGECAECGCQAAPTTGSTGLLGLLGALLLLRRRRA